MRLIYCHKCKALVGELAKGSKVDRGLIYTCATCHRVDLPPGFDEVFKGFR